MLNSLDTYLVSQVAQQPFDTHPLNNPEAVDITAFVSCYNEANIIRQTLDEVSKALSDSANTFEIIVIDDNSSDNSREEISAFIEHNPRMRIIARFNLQNRGLSQNYVDAAFIGSGKYFKLFCGDNTEPYASLMELFNSIGEADILVPYYTEVPGKSKYRLFLSNLFSHIVNIISGHKIRYYNGLQIHLRNNIMRWHPNTRGFGFQADILCMMLDQGFTYKEIGIPAQEVNKSGALTIKNFLSVGHTILEIILRRISNWIYGK